LDPDHEALPYKPEFDLATKRINEEILNLQNLMKSQFKKHPFYRDSTDYDYAVADLKIIEGSLTEVTQAPHPQLS
jgi:hypothetical protein